MECPPCGVVWADHVRTQIGDESTLGLSKIVVPVPSRAITSTTYQNWKAHCEKLSPKLEDLGFSGRCLKRLVEVLGTMALNWECSQ